MPVSASRSIWFLIYEICLIIYMGLIEDGIKWDLIDALCICSWMIETWCHSELVVTHLRLFLILIKMPLERCVATENYLTAFFKNED